MSVVLIFHKTQEKRFLTSCTLKTLHPKPNRMTWVLKFSWQRLRRYSLFDAVRSCSFIQTLKVLCLNSSSAHYHFEPADGGRKFSLNVRSHLSEYVASHPTRLLHSNLKNSFVFLPDIKGFQHRRQDSRQFFLFGRVGVFFALQRLSGALSSPLHRFDSRPVCVGNVVKKVACQQNILQVFWA